MRTKKKQSRKIGRHPLYFKRGEAVFFHTLSGEGGAKIRPGIIASLPPRTRRDSDADVRVMMDQRDGPLVYVTVPAYSLFYDVNAAKADAVDSLTTRIKEDLDCIRELMGLPDNDGLTVSVPEGYVHESELSRAHQRPGDGDMGG